MKPNFLSICTLIGCLTLLAVSGACSHEISHTESDKGHLFDDGRTRTETTVTRNADGSINTERSTQTTH